MDRWHDLIHVNPNPAKPVPSFTRQTHLLWMYKSSFLKTIGSSSLSSSKSVEITNKQNYSLFSVPTATQFLPSMYKQMNIKCIQKNMTLQKKWISKINHSLLNTHEGIAAWKTGCHVQMPLFAKPLLLLFINHLRASGTKQSNCHLLISMGGLSYTKSPMRVKQIVFLHDAVAHTCTWWRLYEQAYTDNWDVTKNQRFPSCGQIWKKQERVSKVFPFNV